MARSRRGAVQGRPVRPSSDSAIYEDDLGSEKELCHDKRQYGNKKGREETKV